MSIITMSDTKDDEFAKVYEKGLKFLSMRQHSVWEIRRKLALRKFNKNLIDQAIEQFIETGYLNDEQFAENYLDSLIGYSAGGGSAFGGKSFGFYGLQVKLRQRGIADEIIKRQLDEIFSYEVEKEIALRVAEKSHEKDKTKLVQKLSRKGFRGEVISQVLKSL